MQYLYIVASFILIFTAVGRLASADRSSYSQAKLSAIARKLNERPRKTLNYETPAQRFYQTVASTG